MNIRNVLRTYSLLRQLTDDESALLNTLRSLNDGERELLVESLSPGKKSTTKKAATKATKSKRATELSDTLRQRAAMKTPAGEGDADNDHEPICSVCGNVESFTDHFKPAPHYHPFASSSPASRAAGQATTATTNDDPNEYCRKEFPGGIVCDEPADANVHHLQTATGYHGFQSGKSAAATTGD